jgi:hypothetical protein
MRGIHVLVYNFKFSSFHTQLPPHVIDINIFLLHFDPISCTHLCFLPHKNEQLCQNHIFKFHSF